MFQNADTEWLHCVTAHRLKGSFTEIEKEMTRYDVIAGKIADDTTTVCWLLTYLEDMEKSELQTRILTV